MSSSAATVPHTADAAPRSGFVLRVVGPSGSGKTTLVERLVEALAARGVRVATAKSAQHHAAPVDKPGSDTERLLRAGSAVCAGGFADQVVVRTPAGTDFAWTVQWLAAIAGVVLVEGGHELDFPALEIVVPNRPRPSRGERIVGRVTAGETAPGEFHRDDIEAIADVVLREAALVDRGS